MSIQNAIAIARSGLYAQQLAIQVASQNIANAQTQGYTRQTLVISPTYPQSTPIGILGTGVRADITRQRDKLVDETYRREAGRNASYTARSDILGQIETVYGEPSDSGLSATMDAFWSSWGDLSNEPTSAPAKAMVRQRAEDVATAINGISGRITEIADRVKSRITDTVSQINSLASQIATLNGNITSTEAGVNVASDLRDSRDRMLDQMAKLGNTRVIESANGSVQVIVDGEALVDGNTARALDAPTFTTVGTQVTVQVTRGGDPVLFPTDGSALGEMVRVLNTEISGTNGALGRLDALASGLVTTTNELHRQGWSSSGEALGAGVWVGTPTGSNVDLFDPAGLTAGTMALSSAVQADYTTIAAGYTKDASSSNQLALDIASLRDDTTTMGGSRSFAGDYKDLVTGVALKISSANNSATVYDTLATNASNRRESISGVSTDEELISLTQHQQAYGAAAKLLQVADEMLQTLLQI
jgi:flagellar hook-associated protein 1 FlgK